MSSAFDSLPKRLPGGIRGGTQGALREAITAGFREYANSLPLRLAPAILREVRKQRAPDILRLVDEWCRDRRDPRRWPTPDRRAFVDKAAAILRPARLSRDLQARFRASHTPTRVEIAKRLTLQRAGVDYEPRWDNPVVTPGEIAKVYRAALVRHYREILAESELSMASGGQYLRFVAERLAKQPKHIPERAADIAVAAYLESDTGKPVKWSRIRDYRGAAKCLDAWVDDLDRCRGAVRTRMLKHTLRWLGERGEPFRARFVGYLAALAAVNTETDSVPMTSVRTVEATDARPINQLTLRTDLALADSTADPRIRPVG